MKDGAHGKKANKPSKGSARLRAGRAEIEVVSLSSHRVADKLVRGGIEVYSVRKTGKNSISVQVARKDCEKVFAILRGSCYNIAEVRERGLALLYKKCLARIGLLIGAALFVLLVAAAQSRVLRIEVVGSGAYYEREVLETLEAAGIVPFSAPPENFHPFTAKILSLPRVTFCEMKCSGGVLTVEVRVSDEAERLSAEPLLSPAGGRVEELVVLRGTPCVQVGDEVEKGQTVVEPFACYGEERTGVLIIARVKISYPVTAFYAGSEEEARAQALLDFGEISLLHAEPAEGGFLLTGRASASAAINL